MSLYDNKLNTQELHSGVGGLYTERDLKASIKRIKDKMIDCDYVSQVYRIIDEELGVELT